MEIIGTIRKPGTITYATVKEKDGKWLHPYMKLGAVFSRPKSWHFDSKYQQVIYKNRAVVYLGIIRPYASYKARHSSQVQFKEHDSNETYTMYHEATYGLISGVAKGEIDVQDGGFYGYWTNSFVGGVAGFMPLPIEKIPRIEPL